MINSIAIITSHLNKIHIDEFFENMQKIKTRKILITYSKSSQLVKENTKL